MSVELPDPVAFGIAGVGGLVLADQDASVPPVGGHQPFFPPRLQRDASDDVVVLVELDQISLPQRERRREAARGALANLDGGDAVAIKRRRSEAALPVGVDRLPAPNGRGVAGRKQLNQYTR